MVNELKRVLLNFRKIGSFLLINKFLLFQYSEGIYRVSTWALVFKVTQNDDVLTLFLTRIKLAVKSQGTLGNVSTWSFCVTFKTRAHVETR